MFGINEPGVFLAYLFTILSALLCVVYGIVNWNKGAENEKKEIVEELEWKKKDKKIEEKI